MDIASIQSRRPAPFANLLEVVPGLYRIRTRGGRAYLDVDGAYVTLVDTGARGSLIAIVRALRALGLATRDVSAIVMTHSHLDHVGGLPEVETAIAAPVSVHAADAWDVESEEPLPNPFSHELLARVSQLAFERIDPGAARVDIRLEDGDIVPGTRAVRVIHVPGHTPGSIALHLPHRRAVLAGDALQYRFGRLMPPNRLFTRDMPRAFESIGKLAALDVETVCFSHFRPIVSGGGEQLRSFASSLDAGRPWKG